METQTTREQILEAIAELPNEVLLELTQFIDYLRYRSPQTPSKLQQSNNPEPRFYETATSEEWVAEFLAWVEHPRHQNYPMLSDEAIGRESIYGERG